MCPNRLKKEKSPYLLQHAENPIDWYPWSDEAFEKAQKENKLIFLSIGYSTCHWCHVMAHEAFIDEETAEFLNKHFISIKVDREERPDVDDTYMLACQVLAENCGWPLNLVMTPDKKPFFAGSYFPKEDKRTRPSLLRILKELEDIWTTNNYRIFEVSDAVIDKIYDFQKQTKGREPGKNILSTAYNIFKASFDDEYGGFTPAPKFPVSHNLSFLIRWYKTANVKKSLEMAEKTLNSMYHGGIFDHIGGGFHRYSTDSMWLIPHFEKMLYDQALLTTAYLEAFQVTNNKLYADVARKTLDYVLRELTSENGAFFCGIDADTEGEEGKFYVWTKEQVNNILGSEAELFCEFYGITDQGNFEHNTNVLHITIPAHEFAEKHNLNKEKFCNSINESLHKLNEARSKRPYPNIDDKIITSWNGLMIKAFAMAGRVLNEDKYIKAAINATEFVLNNLVNPNGKLLRRYRQGESDIFGFLEDYAFLVYGLIELYEATFDAKYLKQAINLTDIMKQDYYDSKDGGFFFISQKAETPIVMLKEAYDGVIPSGNSIAALNLLELADITENQDYDNLAHDIFKAFSRKISRTPISFSQLLIALIYSLGKHRIFLIVENPKAENTEEIINILNNNLIQDGLTLFKSSNHSEINQIHKSAQDKEATDHRTEVYICEKNICKPPLKEKKELEASL